MGIDPAIRDHQAWLGYLQPDGLVVSPAALVDAQVILERNNGPRQQAFLNYITQVSRGDDSVTAITDLVHLLCEYLEWPKDCIAGRDDQNPIPESLRFAIANFGETLEPTFALGERTDETPWRLLIQSLPIGTDLDGNVESKLSGWSASHTQRFERLLREAEVPIGLLSCGTHLRLVYAPHGENVGTLTFPVAAMTEIAGRPILAAFDMLLCAYRLLAAPSEARLPALLKRSRDYQARVSTALARQVLDALYELLRGFQSAHNASSHKLLADALANNPDQVYGGLLSVLMRLVFLLYAEDRALMPGSDLYVRNFSLHTLFERLRTDSEQYPDTMDHRYGAWAQLLALFRVVHSGCQHPLLKMPARLGHLFDPARYSFLEGAGSNAQPPYPDLPLVPDGTVQRVLSKLLLLDGQRLSYRTLDVEQIGSVYETMMGFTLRLARGNTIALKPAKAHGAPVPVNLDDLLATPPKDRAKLLKEETDYDLPAKPAAALKEADTIDGLLAALDRRIARTATPQPVSTGTMVLTPTDERRRSGSHYTPRSLTEPIVRKTLEPILKRLGDKPTPDQILELKVCDPAMGSGAFLVEACRQLADALVNAWAAHGWKPQIPPDEDEVLHARRIIAQRCLYGVDKNPMAVDLAKLSLWLATLARDHPFTFLDHTLRAGDSLVGLTRKQIVAFDLEAKSAPTFVNERVNERMLRVAAERRQILEAGDHMPPENKRQKLAKADEDLSLIRLAGDAAVAAFFAASKPKDRKQKRDDLFNHLAGWIREADGDARKTLGAAVATLRSGEKPVTPFHWEIEFPEVFGRENGGYDLIVGNPPFQGGSKISSAFGDAYRDWLLSLHEGSHGNADLVAHFFRKAFSSLRNDGALGLIATNTIGQGDTRETGLYNICNNQGTIFAANRRLKWPGLAAVVVSTVHVIRGVFLGSKVLDDRPVSKITAYLLASGVHASPSVLHANADKSFLGFKPYSPGFVFAQNDEGGDCTSIEEMNRLIERDSRNKTRIFPYLGGDDANDSPRHESSRFIISFEGLTEEEARAWPDLMRIVEAKVKPGRINDKRELYRRKWWLYGEGRPGLVRAMREHRFVLVATRVCPHLSFAKVPSHIIQSESLVVFVSGNDSFFCCLQGRLHELWARTFASSMKDDLRYTSSDCFETFPFPESFEMVPVLELAGRQYREFRALLMVRNNEGLTKTYNRFHDPLEASPDILKLRELHAAMDRAVLDAYGWTDIPTACEFLLDYEEEDEDDADPTATPRRRKKPWRYRWPDAVRDEVLARLLKLNAERAEEERRTGLAAAAAEQKSGKVPKRRRKKKTDSSTEPMLIDVNEEDFDA